MAITPGEGGRDSLAVDVSNDAVSERATWSGKIAFVLAGAASAIGLGNLWRYPAMAAKYGGGAFVLSYIVLVALIGFTYMVSEIAIGRRTQKSGIAAFVALGEYKNRHGAGWKIIGALEIIVPCIIVPYYCVIGGWITKYMVSYALGAADAIAGSSYFSDFISSGSDPVAWTVVFCVAVMLVIILGVNQGIEKLNKYAMPALLVLSIFIVIFSLATLPHAAEGVSYFLVPNFSDFSIMTVVAAAGQMFYSLSLAMGIMVTYGSYMKRSERLSSSAGWICFFDTVISILAGLMVVPATMSFGITQGGSLEAGIEATHQAGAGLMFITLPQVFDTMPLASLMGFLYFALVFFAALTSAVSLTEAAVSGIDDASHFGRRKSVRVVGIGLILLALLPTLGYSTLSWVTFHIGNADMTILDFADFISNSVLMPFLALVVSIVIGWVVGPKFVIEEAEQQGAVFKLKGAYTVLIKFVVPIVLLVVFVSSVLNSVGVISI
jgi:NSS family neurotransmitter:Na+ symporter